MCHQIDLIYTSDLYEPCYRIGAPLHPIGLDQESQLTGMSLVTHYARNA